jgi:two-component system alkaline phosphatase synthesis response regulator PhoP
MLPKKDGFEVIRELRASKETMNIPVIFLTAKDSEIDEVVGLELGADDYIVKPISIRKLLARVKKAFRKTPQQVSPGSEVLEFESLSIDPARYQVSVNQQEVMLTKKEFEILLFLARRRGRVITRRILLDELWDDNVVVIDRTVDVHIRKIREKLGEDYQDFIETIKGVGYRFKSE